MEDFETYPSSLFQNMHSSTSDDSLLVDKLFVMSYHDDDNDGADDD